MTRTRAARLGVMIVSTVTWGAGLAGVPAVAAPAPAGRNVLPTTVEEQRLDRAVPREILRLSGFDGEAPALARALADARSSAQADRAASAARMASSSNMVAP